MLNNSQESADRVPGSSLTQPPAPREGESRPSPSFSFCDKMPEDSQGPPCVPRDGSYSLSPPQTLLPELPWPLCQKIPGQAEANQPCAKPPQEGPKGFLV